MIDFSKLPETIKSKLVLYTLTCSIIVFFFSNLMIFFGKNHFFSLRNNIYKTHINNITQEYDKKLKEIENICKKWTESTFVNEIFNSFSKETIVFKKKKIKNIIPPTGNIKSIYFLNNSEEEIYKWSKKKNNLNIFYKNGFYLHPHSQSLFFGFFNQDQNRRNGFVVFEISIEKIFAIILKKFPKSFDSSSFSKINQHTLFLTDQKKNLSPRIIERIKHHLKGKNYFNNTHTFFPELKLSAHKLNALPEKLSIIYYHTDNNFNVPIISIFWLLFLIINIIILFHVNYFYQRKEHKKAIFLSDKLKNNRKKTINSLENFNQEATLSHEKTNGKIPHLHFNSIKTINNTTNHSKDNLVYDFDLSKIILGVKKQKQENITINSNGHLPKAKNNLQVIIETEENEKNTSDDSHFKSLNNNNENHHQLNGDLNAHQANQNGNIVNNNKMIKLIDNLEDQKTDAVNFLDLNYICKTVLQNKDSFSKEKDNMNYLKSLLKDQKINMAILFEKQHDNSYRPFQMFNTTEKEKIKNFTLKPTNKIINECLVKKKPIAISDQGNFSFFLKQYFLTNQKSEFKKIVFIPIDQKNEFPFILSIA